VHIETCITHLQIAEDEGGIVASKREMQASKWAANEYASRFPDGVKEVHPTTTDGVKDVHLRGDPASGGGVKEVHTNSPSEHSNEPSAKARVESDFHEFWSAYPNKVGKPKALTAWKAKKPDLATMLAALKRWKASVSFRTTTWLNREGWNDTIAGEKPTLSFAEIEAANRRGRKPKAERRARQPVGRIPPQAAGYDDMTPDAAHATRLIAEGCGDDALLRKLLREYRDGVREFVDSETAWTAIFGASHTG